MAEKDSKPKAAAKKPSETKNTAKGKEPVKETAAKATEKPATKASEKPAAKTTEKPVAKEAEKPATKATEKSSAKVAEKPVAKTTEKPAAKEKASMPAKKAPAAGEKPVKLAATKTETKPKKTPAKKGKPAKEAKQGGAIAAVKEWMNWRRALIIGASFLCVLALILGLALGLRSCSEDTFNPVDELYRYDTETYKTNTRVLYSATTKGTIERNKPVAETKDERSAFDPAAFTFEEGKRYPTYGSTLSYVLGTSEDKVAAREAIISESGYLCAWGTSGANNGGAQTPDKYTIIDKDGWLYQVKDGARVHSLVWGQTENTPNNYRRLYKHTAADGLYLGNVSDDEKAIVKELTLRNRAYNSYSVTGVYAPAGEVLKVEMSDADMTATGGITIHIGQALYNGQANNIWASKNQMQRFPYLLNTLTINKTTAEYDESTGTWTGYIGSFIGGPVYIRNNSATFTVTISGGVSYPHFILGYTTEKQFEEDLKSSAPYFDLEVWDRGVLHSGPRKYAESFSYDDLYQAAVLWDKVASVTTTGSNQGIVFLYDPFVAAGAAVAFPGRSSVNCPLGWMSGSLNYNGIVTSGSWGNFHEYHHNFQGYGVGDGGEVTNNGMTLVSYALFTKISAKRGMSNYGAQGLGDWNNYTSATWALQETLKIARGENPSNGKQGLALYATLLHNFGADSYIKAKVAGGGQSYAAYMNAWQKVTHNNMYYYFNDILQGGGVSNNADPAYPMFVPVSSVYQTGRSYMYDGEKRYFQTMQPYVIPYGDEFTVDLRAYTAPNGQYSFGSIVLPDGFSYEITKVTQPENGTFTATNTAGVYTYKPANKTDSLKSGKIYVTLKITKDDRSFTVDDVDLVLEFEQSHETNKMTINRTTYTYADQKYTDAVTAYENGFAGYTDKDERNHSNPTQNANTDIWFYPNTDKGREDHPGAPEEYFAHKNTVEVLDGKLYFADDGKYRVYLRGRVNCAVYFSLNNQEFRLGAAVKDGSGAGFYPTNQNTYFDVEFKEGNATVTVYTGSETPQIYTDRISGENWVYVREVLIVDRVEGIVPYIGLGYRPWTELMFSMVDKYYTADNKEVASPDDEKYAYTETLYNNNAGTTVAVAVNRKGGNATEYYKIASGKRVASTLAEITELTMPRLIAPTSAAYINAYRSTYQFPDNKSFESEYFYVRNYTYDYKDNLWQNQEQTLIDSNYVKGMQWGNWEQYKIEHIADGDRNTMIHTNFQVTEERSLSFLVDMGEERAVNRMTIYTQYRGGNGDWLCPRAFTLEGSADGLEFFPVGEFTNDVRNTSMTVDFEAKTFRYYRLTVTRSDRLLIISEIEMWRIFEIAGGKQVSPDDGMFAYKGNWHGAQATSNFGHVYVGTEGASVSFEFEGTRLGILSTDAYGKGFEVKIDGKTVSSLELKEDSFAVSLAFLSDVLEKGKHEVTITCTGTDNIDSIVIYP